MSLVVFGTSTILHEAVHKNKYVSGVAAGWLKKVRLETFFSFLQKKNLRCPPPPPPQKKKKKKNSAAQLAQNFGHPLDRKQTFLWADWKLLTAMGR